MRVGIIGAGRIGGNVATRLAKAGHDVVVSFSRDEQNLEDLRRADAAAVVEAVRAGRPIPPTPNYDGWRYRMARKDS